MKRLLLILLLLPSLALASPWSDGDVAREVFYDVILFVDYKQTMDIHNYPGVYENNPYLGNYPTKSKINQYFIASAIAHAAITNALSPEYRKTWQHVTIGFNLGIAANNASLGLRVKF